MTRSLPLITCAFLLTAVPASATTIIFDICEPSIQCIGTQIRMTTALDTITHDIRVSVQGNPRAYGEGALGFNLVEPDVTLWGLSFGYTLGTSGDSIGPFGPFDIVIDGPPAQNAQFSWSFVLSQPGGFANDWEVFGANPLGFYAAATLFRSRATGSDFFFAADDDVPPMNTPVPEPASMLLLGTGLVAAWRARRLSN